MKFVKWFIWYLKEFKKFSGKPFAVNFKNAVYCAKGMCEWDNLSPQQREVWYLSGEGRTMYFN